MSEPKPVVAYAPGPMDWSGESWRSGHEVVVVVRPSGGWRMVKWHVVGIVYFGLAAFVAVADARERGRWGDAAPPAIMYGGLAGILLLLAIARVRSRTVVRVSAGRIGVAQLGPFRSFRTWPRSRLVEVKRNVADNRLWIHLQGEESQSVYVSPDRAAVERVAAEINGALAGSLSAADDPLERWERARAEGRERSWRAGAFGMTLVAFVAAGAWLVCWATMGWGAAKLLGMFLVPVVGVAAGITLGTQEKDIFWW